MKTSHKIGLRTVLALTALCVAAPAMAEEGGTERFSVDYAVKTNGKARPNGHATPATMRMSLVEKTNVHSITALRKAPRNPQPVTFTFTVDAS